MRVPKPNPILMLALFVGLGALLSTGARAEDAQRVVSPDILVSYQGALPALKQRLQKAATRADRLIEGVQRWAPTHLTADGSLYLGPGTPAEDDGLFLSLTWVSDEHQRRRAAESSGFVAEEELVPVFSFRRKW